MCWNGAHLSELRVIKATQIRTLNGRTIRGSGIDRLIHRYGPCHSIGIVLLLHVGVVIKHALGIGEVKAFEQLIVVIAGVTHTEARRHIGRSIVVVHAIVVLHGQLGWIDTGTILRIGELIRIILGVAIIGRSHESIRVVGEIIRLALDVWHRAGRISHGPGEGDEKKKRKLWFRKCDEK